MEEIILNLHNHTTYSDGHGSHQDIVEAALAAGIDVIVTTDHNIYIAGFDGYHKKKDKKVLLLIGEEIHDRERQPQKNHLLVIGAQREMNQYASVPQQLIDKVRQSGGVSYIAHPYDPELKTFHEPDISWEDWSVKDYTGLELWNGLSELKVVTHNYLDGLFYAFFPPFLAHGPTHQTLEIWNQLLAEGKRVTAVGGSDAHALEMHAGPLKRIIFPYLFHFQCINNHLLTRQALSGDLDNDRHMILETLKKGHSFIGYDLPASTRGFRFTAQGKDGMHSIGDSFRISSGVTLQIRIPRPPYSFECRLLKDGEVIRKWQNQEICIVNTNQPGIYRVECSIDFLFTRRGWIYSNPLFINP